MDEAREAGARRSTSAASGPDLLEQYGCGPIHFSGTNDALFERHLLFESIERLNAAEPSRVGRSESWSNPQTKSSGTSKITRKFRSGGMPCHRVRTHIVVAGQTPGGDYRLNWCRTSTGEWKSKG